MKIDITSVVLGLLTGIGAWALMSFLHTDGWVTAVRIFAKWVFPILIGVVIMFMSNMMLNERKPKSK